MLLEWDIRLVGSKPMVKPNSLGQAAILHRLFRNIKSSPFGFEYNPIRGRVKLVHK